MGHNWTEPTCTKASFCERCGTVKGTPSEHKPAEWIVDIPATCTEKGKQHGLCSVCGESITEEIAALNPSGHTPAEEWVVDVPATCTKGGERHKICSVCGVNTDISYYELSAEEKATVLAPLNSAISIGDYRSTEKIINNIGLTYSATRSYSGSDLVNFDYRITNPYNTDIVNVRLILTLNDDQNKPLTSEKTSEYDIPAQQFKEGYGYVKLSASCDYKSDVKIVGVAFANGAVFQIE